MTHKDQSKNQPVDLKKKLEEAKKEAEKKDHSSDELAQTRSELIQMTEMAKRTMADLHNLKRRQEDERRLIITMANVDLIRTLLPILDNFERAIAHTPEAVKNDQWIQGIEMCAKQLHKALTDAGLKPMETVGQTFNPDLHEALAQGPGIKDTITEELEKGYLLGERVIRHAKVKVGNGES